jgi:hypothetical protein
MFSKIDIVNKLLLKIPVLLCLLSGLAALLPLRIYAAVPTPLPVNQPLPAGQLDQLLGPIALYPDPLIAEILPPSTLPTQIVLADRYLIGGGDPNQIAQQPWDASVQAMARYPSVLKWMDDNLNWTTQVGQAFLNQQADVMAAIQRLRAVASKLGNLQSTPQAQVIADGGDIEIVPADPQVIYVPVYQPDQVYFDGALGTPYVSFGAGWPIGGWLDYDCNWGAGNLIFWGSGHSRPANWWRESSGQRSMGHAGVWRADDHRGTLAANRGDRGYGRDEAARAAAPTAIRQELARPTPQENERPESVSRVASAPMERAAPVQRPESDGAFIGVQSSQATRSFSNRGQQSIQATRSAPVMRSAPVSRPASSGGGGFSGGGGGRGGGKR